MNEPLGNLELSAAARQRQQAMLPDLLGAVRHRRRRRQAVRGFAAVLVIGAAAITAQSLWPSRDVAPPEPDAVAWTTFRDDPASVERYAVATVRRSEWFIDDDGLNALLQESGRSTGVIRTAGRVVVNAAAIDPWPEKETEEE